MSFDNLKKKNWEDIVPAKAREGVTRKIFSGKNSMVVLNELVPGAKFSMHNHPHEQIMMILEGRAEVIVEDMEYILGKGDILLIPSNAKHTARPLDRKKVVNLDVFSPVREDYKKIEEEQN